MIVTKISKDSISTLSLPQKVKGQYWIYEGSAISEKNKLIGIEAENNKWMLKSNRTYGIITKDGGIEKSAVLEPLKIYALRKNDCGDEDNIFVFTEPVTDDRQTFVKYLAQGEIELTIGRKESCDIYYPSDFVSSDHAILSLKNGSWHIKDTNSTNGTFVNEKRITEAQLHFGDTIFIMGLKIVIGKSFAAFNDPDGKVIITDKLTRYVSQRVEPSDGEYELPEKECFYRSPRFKRDIETATIKIDSPPSSPIGEEMPWMLVMGSSMAMGMVSAVTLVSAALSNNVTSMVMGGAMLSGTVMLPLITKKYEKNMRIKKEALRQTKYREYLASAEVRINEECQRQEEIHHENDITIAQCEERINTVSRSLWERSPGHNDFLKLRLGIGEGKLDANISYSERKFSLNNDNLEEELYTICEKPKTLKNIPITYSLAQDCISGVIGEKSRLLSFAQGMIIQLASLYSYDEVKTVFIYDCEDEKDLEFVKWLPHVWNDDNSFRFIATDTNELKELSAYLEGIVKSRSEMNDGDLADEQPYYVIFSFSKRLFERAEMVKQILREKKNIHFSIVNICEEIRQLPKECSKVIEIDGMRGRLFDKNDTSGQVCEFLPDIYLNSSPRDLSVRLANITLDNVKGSFNLPKMMTFLQMFGVGKVEHLNALSRWKENDPTKSLEAEVGINTLGDTFKLDLHERFHGPHGLVAGMTGSGKSEFIITYILSLAVNYHPYEVAFILIDYKGGGMAKSFEKLPHTAGIITNLDGAAIKRSLISIESELKRRQAIFAQASKKVGVSNIDIYKYQKLYREGVVDEPLQHLFIISDEFAELKTQQPEFMTQLVSAARIGRSLGVHLILATQKPSGVVDDQIWSNSKFRVCLKVQERADSMDMLKRPDAAELSDTGRFYLQVGYNELFELGQSAWAGAPYVPSDKPVIEKDDSIIVIDKNGHPIKQAKNEKEYNSDKDARKQLDVITEYLCQIADEEKIKVRPLWLEPIPAVILLDELKQKYHSSSNEYVLEPIIGEYDDPSNQKQSLLRLPLSQEGNTVVFGAAGSGKTTFLNAVIYSLISEHTPEEVNLYILDFASETMRAFAKAPHVGDVLLSNDDEKMTNLFKMLMEEVNRRKKLFADYGGDYSSYIASSGVKLPAIVVVINNYAAFTEGFEEPAEAAAYLTREGIKYGIYFVITALSTSGVGFRLLQNYKQIITLQMNDESDYSTLVGKTDGLVPSKFKGRGLIRTDSLYEFQTASLTTEDVPFGFISSYCSELDRNYTGERAKRVSVLPDVVDVEFLSGYYKTARPFDIPVGVEKNSLEVCVYPFGRRYITPVFSSAEQAHVFAGELCSLIAMSKMNGYIIDSARVVDTRVGDMKLYHTSNEFEEAVDEIFDMVLYRNNTYKTQLENGETPNSFENVIVVISALSQVLDTLDETRREKLSLILEKGSEKYNICVIFTEKVKDVTVYSYEKWFKAQFSQSDGIWIGEGFNDQYQFKASRGGPSRSDGDEPGYGYALIKGKASKLKILNSGDDTDE